MVSSRMEDFLDRRQVNVGTVTANLVKRMAEVTNWGKFFVYRCLVRKRLRCKQAERPCSIFGWTAKPYQFVQLLGCCGIECTLRMESSAVNELFIRF